MIYQVKTTKEIEIFYRFNEEHYKNHPQYIFPLKLSLEATFDIQKNPFWKTVHFAFFLYQKNRKNIGRIAVMVSKENPQKATFGFFECIEDQQVAQALFEAAENFAKNYNCQSISGTYNPSINYELGILVDSFEREPFFMMSYNYTYYDSLIKACGYEKEQDFYSFLLPTQKFSENDKFLRVRKKLNSHQHISLRNLNTNKILEETNIIFDIYNDAFLHHFGFVPFEYDEFRYMSKDMLEILNPKFLKIVFVDNQPAGFILALPNLNKAIKTLKNGSLFSWQIFEFLWLKNQIKEVRVINVAIKQKYQHLGLGSLLYHAIYEEMKAHHYHLGQLSWVSESNQQMLKALHQLGATQESTYRVYQKRIF
ncbi:MAG: GNAT family N-acetyltransferase [Raineya sp.]|jgi:GNAT superfamily N-acetyltransferase|nr:GNAT family N-acetyltransferase [Raineya sp.]